MTILSSREHSCVHPRVSKGKNKNEECRKLLDGSEVIFVVWLHSCTCRVCSELLRFGFLFLLSLPLLGTSLFLDIFLWHHTVKPKNNYKQARQEGYIKGGQMLSWQLLVWVWVIAVKVLVDDGDINSYVVVGNFCNNLISRILKHDIFVILQNLF